MAFLGLYQEDIPLTLSVVAQATGVSPAPGGRVAITTLATSAHVEIYRLSADGSATQVQAATDMEDEDNAHYSYQFTSTTANELYDVRYSWVIGSTTYVDEDKFWCYANPSTETGIYTATMPYEHDGDDYILYSGAAGNHTGSYTRGRIYAAKDPK